MNLRIGSGKEEVGEGAGPQRGQEKIKKQRRGYSRRLQPHFLIRFGSVMSS